MERSLSVLLPVRNTQSTLAAQVEQILDVLPDMTNRFEVIIIDDGSTDATIEVADELASRYPQVRAIRHGVPKGTDAAVQTGLAESTGEVICLRDDASGMPIDDVNTLLRGLHGATTLPGPRGRFTTRQSPVGGSEGRARGRFRMVRRAMLTPAASSPSEVHRPDAAPQVPACKPARPNFLVRLRDFTLGE